MVDLVTAQVKQRKVYIKPEVEIVDLMPKQTVLGACLTTSNLAAGYPGNLTPPGPGCGDLSGSHCVD